MSKFKVGDKVRITHVTTADKVEGFEQGDIVTVVVASEVGVFSNDGYFWNQQIELVEPKPHLVCNIGHAPKVPEWATEYTVYLRNGESARDTDLEDMSEMWYWGNVKDDADILFVEFR